MLHLPHLKHLPMDLAITFFAVVILVFLFLFMLGLAALIATSAAQSALDSYNDERDEISSREC